MKFCIINGPNLNLLELRESIYGRLSLEDLKSYTHQNLSTEVKLEWFQSNHEGEIIDMIQDAIKGNEYDGLMINPGGYAHSSVAIRDALSMVTLPKIEVHLTNVFTREEFRRNLVTASAVDYVLSGPGKDVYYMGVEILIKKGSDVSND